MQSLFADKEWHNKCLRARTHIRYTALELNKYEIAVLECLLDRREYTLCWVSQETLQGYARVKSVKTIRKALRSLIRMALIEVVCTKRWEAMQLGLPINGTQMLQVSQFTE